MSPLAVPQTGYPTPASLSTFNRDVANGISATAQICSSAVAFTTANRAIFVPVYLDQTRTYQKAWWLNGATVNGNVDVGIYTISGTTATRVVACTAEAQSGASVMQVAGTFSSTTLTPGLYYIAMSCSSTTATYWSASFVSALQRNAGVFMASTSHPLPNPATIVASSMGRIPMFGFTEGTVL